MAMIRLKTRFMIMKAQQIHTVRWLSTALVILVASLSSQASYAVAPLKDKGRSIYLKACASCHGKAGEGVKREYDQALIGDKSLSQLSRYVEKWMPEEDPETIVGDDAKAVASYIYDEFYSLIAQARNRPPRISLSRMTVRQYRNSITDLIGSFSQANYIGKERGLRAEYYKSRRIGRDTVFKKDDSIVKVDFAKLKDLHSKFDRQGYSARWRGALLAPETGRYELIVKSDQAFKLHFNSWDTNKPFIDAWVKSGDETDFRKSVYLLGGRAYPIMLEYTAHNQGVFKKYKHKEKQPIKGFVELRWKVPHREEEAIPKRHFAPNNIGEVFVLDTPFPPDDRSEGYERGTSITKAWGDATTNAAIKTAGYVSNYIQGQFKRMKHDDMKLKKAKELCHQFAERAFRRPLSRSEKELYIERQFKNSKSIELSVKRVVLLVLKSPKFMYVNLNHDSKDPYAVASRLSFALWDSIPDKQLMEAAAKKQLSTEQQVTQQAMRMMKDRKARSKVREFLHQYLQMDHAEELAKNEKLYPGFSKLIASDLRTSVDLFLDDVVWSNQSNFRDLLLSKELYLNGRLGKYYGYDLPNESGFKKVQSKQKDHSGILTHPFILANFAYSDTSSPIHRGVFLARSVLGRGLRPPPVAVAPLIPDLHPDLTTRERVVKQTSDKVCMSCHGLINSLGFTLEHYDATGRFRSKEKEKPINAKGYYIMPSGDKVAFNGSRDLGEFLADNDQTHRAFVVQLYHYLIKQPIYAYGVETPVTLEKLFKKNQYNIQKTMTDMVVKYVLSEPKSTTVTLSTK